MDLDIYQRFESQYNPFYQTPPIQLDSEITSAWDDFHFIYQLYDELLDRYPQRMQKRLLGYGYDFQGQVSEEYPIYEYSLLPLETPQKVQLGEDTSLMPAPVILLLSGVHGTERAAIYGLYQVIHQALTNPNRHLRLHRMQAAFAFKILPLANPGGYNKPSRENPRGIDLNRNFGMGQPSQAYSEVETQIICQWLANNQGSWAFFDFHNFIRDFLPDRHPAMSSYHISPNPKLNQVYSEFIRKLSPLWREKYLSAYSDAGEIAYGFLLGKGYNQLPTTVNEAYHRYGYSLAAIIESSNQDPNDLRVFDSETVIEFTVDIYMNYLLDVTEALGGLGQIPV